MATPKGLFSNSLISLEVISSLPDSYTVRSLEREDFANGYLDCLWVLVHVGDLTVEQFNERYDEMNGQGKGTYYLLVIEHENRIVGTGSLIVEKKL
jgi:glucosamine-phosphate N-acetyltransferase